MRQGGQTQAKFPILSSQQGRDKHSSMSSRGLRHPAISPPRMNLAVSLDGMLSFLSLALGREESWTQSRTRSWLTICRVGIPLDIASWRMEKIWLHIGQVLSSNGLWPFLDWSFPLSLWSLCSVLIWVAKDPYVHGNLVKHFPHRKQNFWSRA